MPLRIGTNKLVRTHRMYVPQQDMRPSVSTPHPKKSDTDICVNKPGT
jgi:hypothetical protein